MKRSTFALLTLFVSSLTWDAYAVAAPAGSAKAPAQSPAWLRAANPVAAPTPSAGSSFGFLVAVALVGGLAAYAVYARKRRRGLGALKATSGLRVLESARLGPKAVLVTAAVGRRVILLGVTDQSISKLGWLRSDDDADGASLDATLALPVAYRDAATSQEPAREPSRQAASVESKKRGTRPSDGTFAAKLRSALGQSPAAAKSDDALAASAQLTRDVVDLRRSRKRAPAAANNDIRGEEDAMIDVEAQAAGLIRRLKGKTQ